MGIEREEMEGWVEVMREEGGVSGVEGVGFEMSREVREYCDV